jgi:hypothetical protein
VKEGEIGLESMVICAPKARDRNFSNRADWGEKNGYLTASPPHCESFLRVSAAPREPFAGAFQGGERVRPMQFERITL